MKTVFTSHGHNSVSIKYLDKVFDLIENRTFIRRGNYVFEIKGFNNVERQLCRGLSICGITLMVDDSVDLIDVIRKEYKIFKRQQSKTLRG